MHLVHVNSELQSMVSELVSQPTAANFDLGLSGLAPLPYIRKLFFTNLRGEVYTCQVYFRVGNFLLSGQNVTCTHGFVLQSDWYCHSKAVEVDNFSPGCYQALSSPPFLRREPGNEASSHWASTLCINWEPGLYNRTDECLFPSLDSKVVYKRERHIVVSIMSPPVTHYWGEPERAPH